MASERYLPGSNLLIRLKYIGADRIEFDLAKVALEGARERADASEEELKELPKVLVKALRYAKGTETAEATEATELGSDEFTLDPHEGEIDFREEERKALEPDALTGLLDPPYRWWKEWPGGRARITNLARNCAVTLQSELKPGDGVRVDFGTRLAGFKGEPEFTTSDVIVYSEGDPLEEPLPAVSAVPQDLDPVPQDLDLRGSVTVPGNILAGFNKDRQAFLFLRFTDGKQPRDTDGKQAREWLKELVRPFTEAEPAPEWPGVAVRTGACWIATTAEVTAFNDEFKTARMHGDSGEDLKAVWAGLSLTHAGICKLAPELEPTLDRFTAFREGPAKRAGDLGDEEASDPRRWVVGRDVEGEGVDALLTIAADDVHDLQVAVREQYVLAARHDVEVVYTQRGDTLPGSARGHEHFGFKDGVSQPGIRGYTRSVDGIHDADDPGVRIVAKEEFLLGEGAPDWMHDGSFQVFRRLTQDVRGWRTQVRYLNEGLPPENQMTEALLAAKLIGRWPSGTPLDRAPVRDYLSTTSTWDNQFHFGNDPDGTRTPWFAHIRKQNPRRGDEDDKHRILRRGIPFGPVYDSADDADGAGGPYDEEERGLCFNAFMADIERQFEFLQKGWVEDPARDAPDALVGVRKNKDGVELRRIGGVHHDVRLRSYVWTTGAVYAFAPSLPALRRLADGTASAEPSPT